MDNTITAKKELSITRILNAPVKDVFMAWTDPKQLAEWWGAQGFTNPVCRVDLRPGGSIYIEMKGPDGTIYPMSGIFKEIVEPEKLVILTSLRNDDTIILEVLNTISFSEENGKTKLLLHAMITQSNDEAIEYITGMQEGWKQSLGRLEEHLERTRQQPFVIERTFKAPASMVWKAITDKDEMKKWYFDIPEFKPVKGLEFRFLAGEKGKEYLHLCKITEVVEGKKITYSWRYDGYGGNSFVTFELFPATNSTRLRLTHVGLETFPVSNPDLAKENFATGWTHIMNALQANLEK